MAVTVEELVESDELVVSLVVALEPSVALCVDVVWLTEVVEPGCAAASWIARPATPPTPTTTMPTVAWVSLRAPRARTLLVRFAVVM